ncbi:MAG: redoxin domain-containing protein [Candidatus Latescibacterota bacterium]|nr:redoxin domain-containing protein [Candidatus Latescibacterota bacterium]
MRILPHAAGRAAYPQTRLAEEGIVVLAISPDPPEILARFAERYGVEFPLLSDTDSRVIRAWGLQRPDRARSRLLRRPPSGRVSRRRPGHRFR